MDANSSIDGLIAPGAMALAAAALAVLGCCLLLALLEAGLVALADAAPWRHSPAPHLVRRLAFGLCGVSLTLPPLAAAAAMDASPPAVAVAAGRHEHSCPPACAGRLDGLRLPDLPVREQPNRPAGIEVRPGDCLWSIATDRLPPAAGDSEIAAFTRAIYRTNHARIGPDPDLIFPGTLLTDPEATR